MAYHSLKLFNDLPYIKCYSVYEVVRKIME